MSTPHRVRGVHVFDWEQEPIGGRRSEFASTDFGAAPVLARGARLRADPRLQRPRARVGARALLVFIVVVLAAGGWALRRYVPLMAPPLRAQAAGSSAAAGQHIDAATGGRHSSLPRGQGGYNLAVDDHGSLLALAERTRS